MPINPALGELTPLAVASTTLMSKYTTRHRCKHTFLHTQTHTHTFYSKNKKGSNILK